MAHSICDGRNLKFGIHLLRDTDKLSCLLKLLHKGSEIGLLHVERTPPERGAGFYRVGRAKPCRCTQEEPSRYAGGLTAGL